MRWVKVRPAKGEKMCPKEPELEIVHMMDDKELFTEEFSYEEIEKMDEAMIPVVPSGEAPCLRTPKYITTFWNLEWER